MRNLIPELISQYRQLKKLAQSSLYQRMRTYIDPIFANLSEEEKNKLLSLHDQAAQIQQWMLRLSPQQQVQFARQLAAHYGLNPNVGPAYVMGIFYDSIGNARAAQAAFENARKGSERGQRRMTPSPIETKPPEPPMNVPPPRPAERQVPQQPPQQQQQPPQQPPQQQWPVPNPAPLEPFPWQQQQPPLPIQKPPSSKHDTETPGGSILDNSRQLPPDFWRKFLIWPGRNVPIRF